MSKNSKIVAFTPLQDIDEEAMAWVVKLDGGDLIDGDAEALRAWKAQSAQHRDALDRAAREWNAFDSLSALEAKADEALPATDDLAEASAVTSSMQRLTHAFLQRRVAAAACVIAFLVSVVAYSQFGGLGRPASGAYATAMGQQQEISLRDGSKVILNTDSRIFVDFTPTARRVRLLRGEAYFEVISNAARPFSVGTETGVVTAIGTAFTVRVHNANTEVTVSEGAVSLSAPSPADNTIAEPSDASIKPTAVASLKAGERAVFSERVERMETIDESVLSRKLAWRDGMLAFSGEPLGEVIADVSRYTDLDIRIGDPSLRELPVGGYFIAGEIDALLEALELSLNISVKRDGALVTIEPANL